MTDFMMPQDLDPGEVSWSSIDATSVFAADTTGAIRSSEIVGGNALNPTFRWSPLKNEVASWRLRSRAIAMFRRLRGQANRLWLPVPGYTPQGAFSTPEIVANPTLELGTTGYATGSFSLVASDRVLRATRVENVGSVTSVARLSAAATVTQYQPHVLRVMAIAGRGAFTDLSVRAGSTDNGTEYAQSATNLTPGLLTLAFTPLAASVRAGLYQQNNAVSLAGDYLEIPYFSISPCALVDNSPNAFQRSDEIENAYWTQAGLTSVTANTTAAPDGTTTADTLLENSSASQHNVNKTETRTSAAEDWTACCMVKRGSGTRNFGLVIGRDASNYSRATFNLGTGAVNGVTNNGDNANGRAFIVNVGNGWFACYISARLTASTGVILQAEMADGSFLVNYTGDGTSQLHLWRLGAARSTVPFRLGQTTTAATTGTAQSGTNLHLKGLPASTNGAREVGDIVGLGRELHWLATRLNSDAAGLGYLQLTSAVRNAPADNDPVILHNPLGKFLQAKNILDWKDTPGVFTELEVEFLEATAG